MANRYWTESQRVESRWLALCELHGQKLSPGIIAIYMDTLQTMPEDVAVQVLEHQIRYAKWFPKPVDLVEAAEGSREERALTAWQVLIDAVKKIGPYQSVYFEDHVLGRIVEHFNGWIEVCNWTHSELPFRRKEFLDAYRTTRLSAPSRVHCGLLEAENRRRGFLSDIPDPFVVSRDGTILQAPKIPAIDERKLLESEETQCA